MTKILIIDDDEGILDALSLVLKEADYDVQINIKKDAIYKKITAYKPDLILLDILMSGLDGRLICKKLKLNSKSKKIPVIMMSAHPSAASAAKECGADDFLAKPFEISELLSKVEGYVDVSHQILI